MDDCNSQVEIARLQEQVKASATALALAEKLTAAATVAARAQANSNWSSIIAILALLVSLWAVYQGK